MKIMQVVLFISSASVVFLDEVLSLGLDQSQLSSRVYHKLQWKNIPICSNSNNKTLLYNMSALAGNPFNVKKYVLKCSILCQVFSESCYAFQVSVKSDGGAANDVFCYQFNDLPVGVSKYPQNNCSLHVADNIKILFTLVELVFPNVSSWGFLDNTPNLTDSNLIEILGAAKYYHMNIGRGISVYKLDLENVFLFDYHHFNIFADALDAQRMKSFFVNAPDGTIVVGQTSDEPSYGLGPIASYLKKINLDVTNMQFRGKWVFLWQQGAYEKTLSFLDSGKQLLTKQFLIYNRDQLTPFLTGKLSESEFNNINKKMSIGHLYF
ncbi:hypothetical protein HELRODRAFT_180188 [Helobdella robusta]|uniref:ILEI/PANDER domain-containing protein n=1 Tax=Helobdella robusta TaxID=6412 RepID=T1FFK1_HELRO|nr:hypothetical protein HELRODRAFT_180188 [Helobdella robusta]ESN94031.1 hypothetical protein HELRODRAFT_180188 [Helobdella robusta]